MPVGEVYQSLQALSRARATTCCTAALETAQRRIMLGTDNPEPISETSTGGMRLAELPGGVQSAA
jgi:hypothetical protein